MKFYIIILKFNKFIEGIIKKNNNNNIFVFLVNVFL